MESPEILMLRAEHATDGAPWLPTEVWLAQVRRGAWGLGAGEGKPVEAMFNPGMLPYSCLVCKRGGLTKTKLTRCAGCKLVRYCGAAHAKRHWPLHKRYCKALASLSRPRGSADWASAVMAGRVNLGRLEEDAAREDATQLWIHQPHCAACFATEGPFKLCPRCTGVAFCPTCRDATHPTADCDGAILEQCCYGMISDMGSPLAIASRSPGAGPLPSGWKAYFDQKLWDFEVPAFLLAMGPPAAMVTDACPRRVPSFFDRASPSIFHAGSRCRSWSSARSARRRPTSPRTSSSTASARRSPSSSASAASARSSRGCRASRNSRSS